MKMTRDKMERGLRVLIVEHSCHTAKSTAAILASDGHKSRFADNGCDAVRCAQSEAFDAILFDDTLLHMSAREFITNIRRLDIHTPVIILSRNKNETQQNTAMADGAAGCITGPYHKYQLMTCLQAVVPRAT